VGRGAGKKKKVGRTGELVLTRSGSGVSESGAQEGDVRSLVLADWDTKSKGGGGGGGGSVDRIRRRGGKVERRRGAKESKQAKAGLTLDDPLPDPVGEAGGLEVVGGESVEGGRVEVVLEVLEGESVVEDGWRRERE
jgi:hypothetical protein